MTLLCLFLYITTTIHVSILCIPFFFRSYETTSSDEIKEWIMEDMWDIKSTLESQGDAHTKVESESNLT
jgi:hypothetical protein